MKAKQTDQRDMDNMEKINPDRFSFIFFKRFKRGGTIEPS